MRNFRVVIGDNEYEVGIEEIHEKSGAEVAVAERAAPKMEPAVAPTPKTSPAPKKEAPKSSDESGTILAAMPGTITEVRVSQGEPVKRGDTLLILEAMKMENEIKAPRDGIVSTIEVAKGAAVNAGMALLVLV